MRLLGIDVGGTFTDLVFLDESDGSVKIAKAATAPQRQADGVFAALERVGIEPSGVDLFVHGTTIVTNAIIQRVGAAVGMITTAGFRDVLELGRRDRPHLYGLHGEFRPIIERDRRFEVAERLDHRGEVVEPLDEEAVRHVAKRLADAGVEVVVVSFLHSYMNDAHEERAKEILLESSDWLVVTSSEVSPQFYEFERCSTAALHAFVQPTVDRYIRNLEERLAGRGYDRGILFVQSSGGLMSSEVTRSRPANLAKSGPAAGVTAASVIARQAGFENVISADMGGTSFDVCLIPGGLPQIADERLIDFRMPLRVPMIDVQAIGAGGGSIAWIDRGGILQIGPQSAGADPGPASYGHGGSLPTVTDANVALGRIGATSLVGERDPLDHQAAAGAIRRHIGEPMGLSDVEAALAILDVANNKMAGRIRMVSVERGYDPREFALVAFGGAGPLHAATLTRDVGIGHCIIPVYPGVLCALGCVVADVRHDYLTSVLQDVENVDYDDLAAEIQRLIDLGRETAVDEGIDAANISAIVTADMAYEGQRHHVRVPLSGVALTQDAVLEAFNATYLSEYGRLLGGLGARLLTVRITAIGARPSARTARWAMGSLGSGDCNPRTHRDVTFREGTYETPIYVRSDIPIGAELEGPAIIEQSDTTTVLDPAVRAHVDQNANLIIQDS